MSVDDTPQARPFGRQGLSRRAVLSGAATGVVLAGLGRSTAEDPSGAWAAAAALPQATQEIYPTLHDGRIHLAGGLVATDGIVSGATARHVAFTPGENRWRDRTPLPSARHHPSLVSAQGNLYTIGGFRHDGPAAGWFMLQDVERYDAGADMWISVAPLPEPAAEAAHLEADGRIHVIGGRRPATQTSAGWADHRDDDKHWCFDPVENTWERRAPARTWRNSAAGARLGGALHVVGGRQMRGRNLHVHEVYDLAEDRWRRAAPMPEAQSGLAAAAVDGRMYVFGGESIAEPRRVYGEAWAYDPATDAWEPIAPMPNPRHGLGAVAVDGVIYVIGGALTAGGVDTTNIVETFTPA